MPRAFRDHPGRARRELQVLKLIVKGMSNKQIGEELGISQSTVKWHVNIVLARLHVDDRTAAAVAALRRGIIVEL